jgi:hypothetical protein
MDVWVRVRHSVAVWGAGDVMHVHVGFCSNVDPHHFDADSDPYLSPWCGSGFWFLFDANPDTTFHLHADPDPDPGFQIKAQTLEKVLKYAHSLYISGCHLQIDLDPVPDPVYHCDADLDTDPGIFLWCECGSRFRNDVDPDRWSVIAKGGDKYLESWWGVAKWFDSFLSQGDAFLFSVMHVLVRVWRVAKEEGDVCLSWGWGIDYGGDLFKLGEGVVKWGDVCLSQGEE